MNDDVDFGELDPVVITEPEIVEMIQICIDLANRISEGWKLTGPKIMSCISIGVVTVLSRILSPVGVKPSGSSDDDFAILDMANRLLGIALHRMSGVSDEDDEIELIDETYQYVIEKEDNFILVMPSLIFNFWMLAALRDDEDDPHDVASNERLLESVSIGNEKVLRSYGLTVGGPEPDEDMYDYGFQSAVTAAMLTMTAFSVFPSDKIIELTDGNAMTFEYLLFRIRVLENLLHDLAHSWAVTFASSIWAIDQGGDMEKYFTTILERIR